MKSQFKRLGQCFLIIVVQFGCNKQPDFVSDRLIGRCANVTVTDHSGARNRFTDGTYQIGDARLRDLRQHHMFIKVDWAASSNNCLVGIDSSNPRMLIPYFSDMAFSEEDYIPYAFTKEYHFTFDSSDIDTLFIEKQSGEGAKFYFNGEFLGSVAPLELTPLELKLRK